MVAIGGSRLNSSLGAFASGGVARGGNIRNVNGNQGNSSSGLGSVGGDGGDPPISNTGFVLSAGDGSGSNGSLAASDGNSFGGGGGGLHMVTILHQYPQMVAKGDWAELW